MYVLFVVLFLVVFVLFVVLFLAVLFVVLFTTSCSCSIFVRFLAHTHIFKVVCVLGSDSSVA